MADTPKTSETKDTLRFFLKLALFVFILRSFIVTSFVIPSESMLPRLLIGDYLFVTKWNYGYSRWSFPFGLPLLPGRILGRDPARGDVVVFRSPGPDDHDVIKRVIGLPGDTIQVTNGQIILNGRPVPKQRIADFVLPYAQPVWRVLAQAKAKGQRILFEGAQGVLLDIDHGTYPFVTSSNTIAGAAAGGSGLGPSGVGFVLGIAKAYTTRVGSGPFPTELEDETGQRLGERGHEFGTVTGRKRRCGWFDSVLVRQSAAVGGITGIALTKIDVLDGFETVKICTGYRLNGAELDYFPAHAADQANVVPIYEEMEGWQESTAGARSWADLPAQAIKYIRRVEELIRCPVALVSTSPEREDTILVRDPFAD